VVTTEPRRRSPRPRAISAASPNVARGWSLPRTFRLLDLAPWPWQTRAARVGYSRRANRWRYPIVVVVVPRQSGKTRLVQVVAIDRCLHVDGAQVWYTAQSRMDAVLRWRELVRLLRRSSRVEGNTHRGWNAGGWDYRVRGATGSEEIEFKNGAQLRVFAPAEDSLHGSVTDLVVLDEARFFDVRHGDGLIAAALPTQATRDGQIWIPSTAGGPDSRFLARQVEVARAALGDPAARVALVEYGIGPDIAAGDLLGAVWRAHPSAGMPGGPVYDALAVASEHMPAWQFAHEYGNRWRTDADVRVLPADKWAATSYPDPLPPGAVTFAADIPPDRSESTICACAGGVVEVVDLVPAAQVAARLVELAGAWNPTAVAIDAAGPAGTVAEQLRPVFDRLVVTSTRDLQVACAAFYDAILDGTGSHRPNVALDAAATVATRRPIGQAWVWSRVDGGSALVAASLARWVSGRAPVEIEPSRIW
jgi:hypothetical protein